MNKKVLRTITILTFFMLNIQANNANFKGVSLRADDTLNLDIANNLNISSLRNTTSSNSKGYSVGGGLGFGNGNIQSVNAGFSTSNGSSLKKQTLLTSITANKIDANIKGNTNLKGALFASGEFSKDGTFIDNNNLNLKTDTLTFTSLSNTNYSNSNSIGANLTYNLTKTQTNSGGQKKETTKGISNIGYNASNQISGKVSKTQATLGKGNIVVASLQNSDDLSSLNRDTKNITKQLYSASTGTKVDASLDMRLLSEDGRKSIKEDFKKTELVLQAVKETATTSSTSFFGDNESGVSNFFENVKDKNDLFEATKKFANDPNNKNAKDTLLNPNANTDKMKQAQQSLHNYVAIEMGITPKEVALMIDGVYKGFTPTNGDKTFLASNNHNTNGDISNTTINETSDVADAQRDINVIKNDNYTGNRDEYSSNFGNLGESLLNYQYSQTDNVKISNVPYNQVGTNLNFPNQISQDIKDNTKEFSTIDKSQGAHRQLNFQEIDFIKENAKDYAKLKYNTTNPTPEQIQGATYDLAQEGLRGVDAVWNVLLGERDESARAYLDSIDKTFTNSHGEKQQYFTAQNSDYLNPAKYANETQNSDIYDTPKQVAKQTLDNIDSIKDKLKDKIEFLQKNALKNTVESIKTQGEQLDKSVEENGIAKTALDMRVNDLLDTINHTVNGLETGYDLYNTDEQTLNNIYGNEIGTQIDNLETSLVIGSVVVGSIKGGGKSSVKNIKDDVKFVHNPVKKPSIGDERGIIFGELDTLGRPTGVLATITQDMIGTGSKASQNIRPPGFVNGNDANHARGHLLANILGGSGKDNKNLVTLYQQSVNSPIMRDFEKEVKNAVKNGETVNYRVVPIYTGNNPIPTGITMSATGSNGFRLDVSIPNVNGKK